MQIKTKTEYTREYLAYCKFHGKTPEEMMSSDSKRFPGGVMCGFIVWFSEVRQKFRACHPECFIGDNISDHEAKIRFMEGCAQAKVLAHC